MDKGGQLYYDVWKADFWWWACGSIYRSWNNVVHIKLHHVIKPVLPQVKQKQQQRLSLADCPESALSGDLLPSTCPEWILKKIICFRSGVKD